MKEKRMFKGANPTLELKGNSLIAPPKTNHFSHLAEHRVGEFLNALDKDRKSSLIIQTFLYVVMVTGLRTGSLANAKWSWLDSKTNTLHIPSLHMKGRVSFRCPLPTQAIVKLNALKTFLNGKSKDYIFEGNKGKPISDATARLCLQRLTGDKTTVHGFRTLFNIVVSKMNKFEIEKIESQLTHAFTSTDIRKVYMGKEDYLEDRRKIVQAYEDWCDKQ
jgi:integrase